MLIWACSPHAKGTTDALAKAAAGATGAEIIQLRSWQVAPCTGCGQCQDQKCRLEDDTGELFARLAGARVNLFIAPIYFYGLPAPFKAFIDRGQVFWEPAMPALTRKAYAIFIGGSKGPKLFEGATLTLSYFLRLFGIALEPPLGLTGVNSRKDLTKADLARVRAAARTFANG